MKHKKNLSLARLIPNMITLTAMASGMTSIKFAVEGRWEDAVMAIVVAAFLDAFDGAAARMLKAQSELGAELDSLSDFLCFGVAPSLVTFLWITHDAGKLGWLVSLIFTMAVALRLARFNIMEDEEGAKQDPVAKFHTGVPSPPGAGLALLPMIISFQMDKEASVLFAEYVRHPQLVAVWMVVLGAMMVSHIPTFSSKQIKIPQKLAVPALGVFAILLSGLINETWATLTLMGVVYLLSLPFSLRRCRRNEQKLTNPPPSEG